MTTHQPLVPIYDPSLAELLAQAEADKGAPLTEPQVLAVRDSAQSVMMQPADAQQVIADRGFRDVNPDNCWADWHRLRVEVTGNGILPEIVLCVPGGAEFPSQCGAILRGLPVEYEISDRDPLMVRAFELATSHFKQRLGREEFARIGAHTCVLTVSSKEFTANEAATKCLAFLQLGRRLLEAGGAAIKCDSTGIAHARAQWIRMSDRAAGAIHANNADTPREFWTPVFLAYVQFPIVSGDDVFTCGMHLLGKPDLIVATAVLQSAIPAGKTFEQSAVELFHVFGLYLLIQCGQDGFISGRTFRVEEKSRPFRVVWEPCSGYAEDDLFFNPFGRLRFLAI